MIGLAVGFACAALGVSLLALGAAAWAIIDVMAFRRSTHQVQFVDASEEAKEASEDKILNKVFSDEQYHAMREAYGNDREVKQ